MKKQALSARVRKQKKLDQYIRGVKILAYADDVVFLTNAWASKVAFYETSLKFNFKINLKKTNFLSQTKKQDLSKLGCNWVDSFKYLGVNLNIRGSLKQHYINMKKIVKKNSGRINFMSLLLPARHIFKLWQLYVKPYFDYISTALWIQKQTIIEQYKALWRSCLRIMAGMHKCMQNKKVEYVFGEISYFGNEDQLLYKQEERNLERWTIYSVREEQKFQLRNSIINQQTHLDIPFLPIVENKKLKYITMLRKDLKLARWQALANRTHYRGILDDIPQWNSNTIRKIPNQGYFDMFKYDSMLCKECNVPLSLKHIDSHFQTNFEYCRRRLEIHVVYITKKFNKGDQKFFNDLAKSNSKQLHKLAQQICIKRTHVKKNKIVVLNQNQIQK